VCNPQTNLWVYFFFFCVSLSFDVVYSFFVFFDDGLLPDCLVLRVLGTEWFFGSILILVP